MDKELKNMLWNCIAYDFIDKLEFHGTSDNSPIKIFYEKVWVQFFKKTLDTIPAYTPNSYNGRNMDRKEIHGCIRNWYFEAEWYEIYNFIEFISEIQNASTSLINITFDKCCNIVLKKELSGYRVVKGNVVQITSEEEILEIEEAINHTSHWDSVNTHLTTALHFLANRENPNYRNSIKESISAVEALCVIITNDPKATLGKALAIIEKKHSLHGALKDSFSALYGYTSDASGIRHSLIENDTPVDFEEAKFMLVSCSAFINFLKAKFTV